MKKKTTRKRTAKKTTRKRPAKKAPAARVGNLVGALSDLAEPIDGLHADPANARAHDEASVASIAASLERFGQRRPVVVNRDGRQIEAGHGVVEAARRLGWSHVAVLWVTDDKSTATGFALADNRTAELSTWDDERLRAAIATVDDVDADLSRALLLDKIARTSSSTPGRDDVPPDNYREQYGVIVVCEDEAAQEATYKDLTEIGYTCRVVTT